MDDRRRARILAEIIEHTTTPPREWYQITAREYAKDEGCTHGTATRRLDKLVAAGTMKKAERKIETGHTADVWWRPEDEGEVEHG